MAKPFDNTRHTHIHPALPEAINANPKPIVINYEHITTPELTIKCSKGEISAAGFHHDYMGAIEKSGLIEIKDKVMLPNGCYKFNWKTQSTDWKPSTLFPQDWTKAQTIEKIYESLGRTQEIEYRGSGRYSHLGETSEGIVVLTIIEIESSVAKIISSYPVYK